MENRDRISSNETDELVEQDLEAPIHALTDIIMQLRTLRKRASEHELKMVSYLLHMAEVEATDLLSDNTTDISLKKH